MRRSHLLFIAIQRMSQALELGENSPYTSEDLSSLLGFDLELVQGLSSDALLFITSDMAPEQHYLLGLAIGHLAVDYACPELGDRAATVLISATDTKNELEGPGFVAILQNLLRLRRRSA